MLKDSQLKSLRFLARKKFSKSREMFFPSRDSFEQATPEAIALSRAKRLKCDVAVDLCCGIGMDSIALSKNCSKVFSFDTDREVLDCARENAKVYDCNNIEFFAQDALSVDLKKFNPNIVFADPSRRKNNIRVSSFSDTLPRTDKLIEKIKDAGITDFCIEISREFPLEKIKFDCEKEFVSLNHELNCISLYFGKLKKCDKSIVLLPENAMLESNIGDSTFTSTKEISEGSFLAELDEAIVKAIMQKALLEQFNGAKIFNRNFFVSDKEISSPFFKNTFRVLEILPVNFEKIVESLKKLDAGQIVLRASFDEKTQLKVKSEFNEKLFGTKKMHLFLFEGKALICRNTVFGD